MCSTSRFLMMLVPLALLANPLLGEDLVEQWRAEYPEALKKNYAMTSLGDYEAVMSKKSGGKTELFKTIRFKTDGKYNLVSYWFEDELKKDGPEAKTTVVNGPKKTFRIAKNADDTFKPLSARVSDKREDSLVAGVAEPIYAPIAISGSGSLLELIENNRIEVIGERAVDKQQVEVEYKFLNSGSIGKSRFDRSLQWLAERHELNTSDGKPSRMRTIRYNEWDAEGNLIGFETEGKSFSEKQPATYTTHVKRISVAKPDPREFTLEFYNLPSNLGDSTGFNGRLVAYAVVILIIGAVVIRSLLKK